jgi:hypothetical protein
MQAPPPPDSVESNYPRPGADDRQMLRDIAAAQRQVIICVLCQIGIVILDGVGAAIQMMAIILVGDVLALALLVFMVISIVKLSKALAQPAVLYAILMFVPCISLIVLLVLSGKASARLQQAGVKVGLMGADPNAI